MCERHVPACRALGPHRRHPGPPPRSTAWPLASSHRHARRAPLEDPWPECDMGNNRAVATPITFAHRGASADAPENTLAGVPPRPATWGHGAWSPTPGCRRRRGGAGARRRGPPGSGGASGWPSRPPAELAELDVPRLADLYTELGTEYELSLDVYDPAVGERILEVAAAADAARPPVAVLARSRAARDARRAGDRRCTSCTRSGAATVDVPLERHAARPRRARASTW